MRANRLLGLTMVVAALAVFGASCSSKTATDGNMANTAADQGSTDGGNVAVVPVATGENTVAPTPPSNGEWPPADPCALIDPATAESIAGQTLGDAPLFDPGEFLYGPTCAYSSATYGLFLTIYTYSPEDLATYTEGWVAGGQVTELSGLGDSALVELRLADSIVYVTAGARAFSVQAGTTEIATSVARAIIG